jgi:hypothetical protein
MSVGSVGEGIVVVFITMNEEQTHNKGDKKSFELAPLAPEQYPITSVPKTTIDLPFFYLTKQKNALAKPIHFEGIDDDGRPYVWDVIPPNPIIGSPAIDAHEAWTRLVKPTWEAYRTSDDRLPDILPLGGVRRCLRVVGWGQGGWEAQRLLKALNQIGASWCNIDFWVPTNKKDEEGKTLSRRIKGNFSRLTIYAIGDKHITDDDLKDGKFSFDFDLDDTIYIQFNSLEVSIQESQPQRYLDNQYMFSVGPASRRWYELMAAKVFGVVKNNGQYCDILYSWYVKHHHTLTREIERRRVVQQMNRVVQEHIDSGFIRSVEYRPIRELGKTTDFVVRYTPGPTAKQSIARVVSSISKRRTLPEDEPRRRLHTKKLRTVAPGLQTSLSLGGEGELRAEAVQSAPIQQNSAELGRPQITNTELFDERLLEALTHRGIMRAVAVTLLTGKSPDELLRVQDFVEYWDSILSDKKQPGLLVSFIQRNDKLPDSFITSRQRAAIKAATERNQQMVMAKQSIELAYDHYKDVVLDRYIAEEFPKERYVHLLQVHKQEMSKQGSFFQRYLHKPGFEDMVRNAVRAEIRKTINFLSFEEFCRQEAPRILTEYGIEPAVLGIAPASNEAEPEPNKQ